MASQSDAVHGNRQAPRRAGLAQWAREHRPAHWAGRLALFELVWRLIDTVLVIPLCNLLIDWCLSGSTATRSATNAGLVFDFLTPTGIVTVLVVLAIALAASVFEITVLVTMVRCLMAGATDVPVRDVYRYAAIRLADLWHPSAPLAAAYYLGLIPLIHVGYATSLLPTLSVPNFVTGELQLTVPGTIGVVAFHAAMIALFLLLMAVPIMMACGRGGFGAAMRAGVAALRHVGAARLAGLCAAVIAVYGANDLIVRACLEAPLLKARDFNVYLLRYLVNSSLFREQFVATTLFWAYLIALSAAFTALLLRLTGMAGDGEAAALADEIRTLPAPTAPRWMRHRLAVRAMDGAGHLAASATTSVMDASRSAGARLRAMRHRRAALAVVIVVALVVMGLYVRQEPLIHRPIAIGHRGELEAAENSLNGIRVADDYHADFAEIDVKLTADGELVVFHDDDTSRLAAQGESLVIADSTLAELQAVSLVSRGETFTMPTLAEAIETARSCANGIGLLIELKPESGQGAALADKVIEQVDALGYGEEGMFMSLDRDAVNRLQEQRHDWWVGYCMFGALGNLYWDLNADFLALEESQINTKFLEQARTMHIPVYVWTVDDYYQVRNYVLMGVSGVIGNAVDQIRSGVDDAMYDIPYVVYDDEGMTALDPEVPGLLRTF